MVRKCNQHQHLRLLKISTLIFNKLIVDNGSDHGSDHGFNHKSDHNAK